MFIYPIKKCRTFLQSTMKANTGTGSAYLLILQEIRPFAASSLSCALYAATATLVFFIIIDVQRKRHYDFVVGFSLYYVLAPEITHDGRRFYDRSNWPPYSMAWYCRCMRTFAYNRQITGRRKSSRMNYSPHAVQCNEAQCQPAYLTEILMKGD